MTSEELELQQELVLQNKALEKDVEALSSTVAVLNQQLQHKEGQLEGYWDVIKILMEREPNKGW